MGVSVFVMGKAIDGCFLVRNTSGAARAGLKVMTAG